MISSKLTTKAQTTIPQTVRTALGMRTGKAKPVPPNDPFRAFDEWSSEADRRAYAKL